MNSNKIRKCLSILLSAVMAFSMSLVFVQEGNAATTSTKKTYHLPTKIIVNNHYANGAGDKITNTFSYDKRGLLTTWKVSFSQEKVEYKRNSKGVITSETFYVNGKKDESYEYKINKKGRQGSAVNYMYLGKSKDFGGKYKFYYSKGKLYKQTFDNGYGAKEYNLYYSNGYIKKYHYYDNEGLYTIKKYDRHGHLTYSSDETFGEVVHKLTHDKKGQVTKDVITNNPPEGKQSTDTIKTEYTYDKKGRITKKKESAISHYNDEITYITTYTYKYNSNGTLAKEICNKSEKDKNGKVTKGDKRVTTYKYKTVKVAKKYQKYVYDRTPRIDPKKPSHQEDMPFGLNLAEWLDG